MGPYNIANVLGKLYVAGQVAAAAVGEVGAEVGEVGAETGEVGAEAGIA